MKILITGAAGFLAAHFVEFLLKNTDWEIVLFDRFTHGAIRLQELKAFESPRVSQHAIRLEDRVNEPTMNTIGQLDYIVHLGGRTQLSESLNAPLVFMEANILGTCQMLELARRQKNLKKFLYLSSDEMYGPSPDGSTLTEQSPYNPLTPYAATKISAVELTLAWGNTYGVPVVIATCMSLIGERQPADKFLPRVVRAGLTDKAVTIYVDQKSGHHYVSDFLHARDVVSALMFLLENGKPLDKYNVAGIHPHRNLKLVLEVERILKRPIRYERVNAAIARPGFAMRSGLNGTKLLGMGWRPLRSFEQSVEETVLWMVRPENLHWLGI
jgi:dTDP-glucose 4,6-dehydratase